MTREEMKNILDEIAARLDVIYRVEKHWAQEWKKGDTGMKMFPPASPAAIGQLERKMGKPLPPSYREFLSITDGCEHFWADFSFTGTSGDHSKRVAEKIAEYIEWQKEKFIGKVGQPDASSVDTWERATSRNLYLERHLPIATTFGGELYVFDTRTRQSDGDMEIVFWDISFGAWEDQRYANFGTLLEKMLAEVNERAQKYKGKIAKTANDAKAGKSGANKHPSKKPTVKAAKKGR